ncbi:MAG TPA: sigma-54 dependent transcriptional regulator [Longimicrobiales bacterium]|nr:sigma-54 dependent transcriptional regulator [Longimicrobiales bacterium]
MHTVLSPASNESVQSRHPVAAASGDPSDLDSKAKSTIRILVVDDEHTLRESCASVLRLEGYSVTVCARADEALSAFQKRAFDIVLLDLYMGQTSGMELLRSCLETKPDAIAIMMTGNPTVGTSIEALRAGAWDYLPKPFSANHLNVLIGRAAHAVLIARESAQSQEQAGKEFGHSEKVAVLGASPAFRNVIDLARRVATTDASVFISGESGTGKEQIAQFIHHHSRRSSRPLVAVNCAALPEALLESEMFGHVKGAFTGAVRDKPGLLETANGGTLFLDELTEMPTTIQAKLLRVIQDGVVRRVGSTTTDAVVNVRFIAATNRDPQEAIDAGLLRKDLYYRLRVVPVRIPPLRERAEDVPVLAQFFLAQYWKRHRGAAAMPRFTARAMRSLQERIWTGNVRELQNAIEHTVVLLDPGCDIEPENVASMDDSTQPDVAVPLSSYQDDEAYHSARDRIVAQFEKNYLRWLVSRARGNMSKAARIAGVDRTTLYRLMEKHELQRDTLITMQ